MMKRFLPLLALTALSGAPLQADELHELAEAVCKRGLECARPQIEAMRAQMPPEMVQMMEQTLSGAYCQQSNWVTVDRVTHPKEYEAVRRCLQAMNTASCDLYLGEEEMHLPECDELQRMAEEQESRQ